MLDPTFLLSVDEWRSIARYYSVPSEKYIFCYFLGENPLHREWVDDLAGRKGLKVICISSFAADRNRDWYINPFIGPREFLGYIDKAELIMTDSFHAMALSINFNKDFYIMERFKNNDVLCQNSRVTNITDALKLEDRILKNHIKNITSINYKEVNKRLVSEKNKALEMLGGMLQEGCMKGE